MADDKSKRSWHLSCASKFCQSTWKTPDVEYYTLTKLPLASKKLQDAYLTVLGKQIDELNCKKQVICSRHWQDGKRRDLDDLPAIKFTENGDRHLSNLKKEHWHCAAVLCTNSWRTKGKHLKYYRLKDIASCPEKRLAYSKVFKSKGTDFNRDFICSAHWSKGERDKKVTKNTTPVRKMQSAKRSLTEQQSEGSRKKKRRVLSYNYSNESSNVDLLQKEVDDLKEKLRGKTNEVNQLCDLVKTLEVQNETYQSQLKQFVHKTEKSTFSYKCLKNNPKQFFYITGLSVEDFDCLFACVEPDISAMVYPDCKTHQQRKLTKKTELMCFMTVCRHTLHLGIMGFMTNTSDSTQSRIFTAWAVFLSTLFDQLDLSPCPGEVLSLLPMDFYASGFKDTVLLDDCTENWIASPENYDISRTTFSSYKNHDTGKTGIWITLQSGNVH